MVNARSMELCPSLNVVELIAKLIAKLIAIPTTHSSPVSSSTGVQEEPGGSRRYGRQYGFC